MLGRCTARRTCPAGAVSTHFRAAARDPVADPAAPRGCGRGSAGRHGENLAACRSVRRVSGPGDGLDHRDCALSCDRPAAPATGLFAARRRARRGAGDITAADFVDTTTSARLRKALNDCFSRLTAEQRRCLELAYVDGYSQDPDRQRDRKSPSARSRAGSAAASASSSGAWTHELPAPPIARRAGCAIRAGHVARAGSPPIRAATATATLVRCTRYVAGRTPRRPARRHRAHRAVSRWCGITSRSACGATMRCDPSVHSRHSATGVWQSLRESPRSQSHSVSGPASAREARSWSRRSWISSRRSCGASRRRAIATSSASALVPI